MANVTTTTAAKYLAEVWTKKVEKPFYKSLFFADLVNRRDNLVASGGKTIHVPFLSSYDARDKSASTQVTFDANTESEVTISINKHKYLAFLLEDFVLNQANYELQSLYRSAQAEAIARAIDTDIAGLHASAGTNVSGGASVDDADILSAIQALDAGNVPQSERYLVCGSKVMNDLRTVNKYSTYDQTGKTGTAVSGQSMVPNVYGVEIHMSNNVVDDTSNTHNLLFHKSAITLAIQNGPTYKMFDSVADIGLQTVLHTQYGVAVERAGAFVDIERNS